MAFVKLGPGTLEIGDTAETLTDFSGEVKSGQIKHDYETVGEKRRFLDGTGRDPERTRNDGAAFELENDMSAAGLYAYLQGLGENPAAKHFRYTPNTAAGAVWAGKLFPLLPASVGADEYGAPLASSVEWPGDGIFSFTPASA